MYRETTEIPSDAKRSPNVSMRTIHATNLRNLDCCDVTIANRHAQACCTCTH